MAAITGIDGDVLVGGIQICEVGSWDFTPKANNKSYVSNLTGGFVRREVGAKDATGQIKGRWNPNSPVYGDSLWQLKEGSAARLLLYFDGYTYHDVQAIIDTFSFTLDIDTGEIVSWGATFSSKDYWTANISEEEQSHTSSYSSSSTSSSASSSSSSSVSSATSSSSTSSSSLSTSSTSTSSTSSSSASSSSSSVSSSSSTSSSSVSSSSSSSSVSSSSSSSVSSSSSSSVSSSSSSSSSGAETSSSSSTSSNSSSSSVGTSSSSSTSSSSASSNSSSSSVGTSSSSSTSSSSASSNSSSSSVGTSSSSSTSSSSVSSSSSSSSSTSSSSSIIDEELMSYVNQSRLSLESGVPVSTTNQTDAATVYLEPYKGDRIALYDGADWNIRTVVSTSTSVAVPATLFRCFDVYAYDNATVVTLEATSWDQTTKTINGFTAGTQTLQTSAAHGFSVGDKIGIAGITGTVGSDATYGANARTWKILTVPTSTTFTVEGSNWAALAYTSGGTTYTLSDTRTTDLTTQDGVYVKTGATTRRYIGTCETKGVSGTVDDAGWSGSANIMRGVWNYYNRVWVACACSSTSSHTYATGTDRFWNLLPDARVHLTVGVLEEHFTGGIEGTMNSSVDGTNGRTGTGANGIVIASPIIINANLKLTRMGSTSRLKPSIGHNWYQAIENCDSTVTLALFTMTIFSNR